MNKFEVGDVVERTGGPWEDMQTGDRATVSELAGPYEVRLSGFKGLYDVRNLSLRFRAEQTAPAIPPIGDPDDSPADLVNHPPHYTSDPSGVECIQITRHRNFNIGNAFKYLWRLGLKESADKTTKEKTLQDIDKAIWYLKDERARIEAEA